MVALTQMTCISDLACAGLSQPWETESPLRSPLSSLFSRLFKPKIESLGGVPPPPRTSHPLKAASVIRPAMAGKGFGSATEQQCWLGDKTSAQTGVGGKIRKDSLELGLKLLLSQGVNLKSAPRPLPGPRAMLGSISGR